MHGHGCIRYSVNGVRSKLHTARSARRRRTWRDRAVAGTLARGTRALNLFITLQFTPKMATLSIEALFRVAGKRALVTGGGRGIGKMITKGLVANGARVAIASRDEKVLAWDCGAPLKRLPLA